MIFFTIENLAAWETHFPDFFLFFRTKSTINFLTSESDATAKEFKCSIRVQKDPFN